MTSTQKTVLFDPELQNKAAMLVNEGIALLKQQRHQEGLALFNKAVELKPDFALAYFNRGIVFKDLFKLDLMEKDFQTAMALDPHHGEMYKNIAIFLLREGRGIQSIIAIQRCLELLPDSEIAWLTLLDAHYLMGNTDTVEKLCEHLVKKFPKSTIIRVTDALYVPQIAMSKAEIERIRMRVTTKLEAFLAEGLRFDDPLMHIRSSSFYLNYHGVCNRSLAETIAQFLMKTCRPLNFTAPHCLLPRKQRPEKLRVGFVSPSMHQETLNQFYMDVIEAINDHPAFECLIFSNSPPNHPAVLDIKKRIPGYVDMPMDYGLARDIIAEQKPDILIYMEVGSHQLMSALPSARLAPVQCTVGGLPVTTGIPNMDYYITSHDLIPENAQEQHSEKLALLSSAWGVKGLPELTLPLKTREDLGLPTGDIRLYACPVQLFKLHPDMDAIFDKILERDPKALILLFDVKKTIMQNMLRKRFALSMSEAHQQRILFLPYASRADFMHVLRAVDSVLDSFHFSFGTVAFIAFAAGAPFVTWPAPLLSGRCAYRMFNAAHIPELIASSHDDYVDIAVKLANDKAFSQEMARRMAERNAMFVGNSPALIDELTAKLQSLYFDEIR